MLWFGLLVVIVVLLFWKRWRIKNKKLLEFSNKTPGPPTIPILGNALDVAVPSEELSNVFGNMIQKYGDVFRVWFALDMNIFVSDPDDIKTLLSSSKTSIRGPTYKYIADYCGNGILSGSGSSWRTSRKIVLPNYGKKALEGYEDVINRESTETVNRLRKKPRGETFDIYDEVVWSTSYTVYQTLMGLTREQTLNLPNLNEFIHQATGFKKSMLAVGDAMVKHRMNAFHEMDKETPVDEQKTELSVVERLVLSKQIPSYEEILKQLFTIFASSQESTAKISSFFLLMMAFHPDCQNKVYAEIKEVFGDSDRDVTDEDLIRMTYLDMVFKEVLRLFPAAVMLHRVIAEDITISTGTLPARSSLVIPLFFVHRDKRYWTNPDAFDPERFSPENSRLRHPNCYIPFSLGPMACLGRNFANKLVKTLCLKILREFRLSSPESYADLRLVMAVAVDSLNGYPVQLHPRI